MIWLGGSNRPWSSWGSTLPGYCLWSSWGSTLPGGSIRGNNRRSGFTLIELIVVMGLIAVMTAIGIGSFRNLGRSNRLAATETLVTGVLRQARSEARMTGAPVELVLTGAAIYGTSRHNLCFEGFEGSQPPDASLDEQPADTFPLPFDPAIETDSLTTRWAVPGRTGTGCSLKANIPGDGFLSTIALTRDRTLRPRDGFVLSCSLWLPPVQHPGPTIPVITLSEAGGSMDAPFGTARCAFGVIARPSPLEIYDPAAPNRNPRKHFDPPDPSEPRLIPLGVAYQLIVWTTETGGTPQFLDSETNTTRSYQEHLSLGRGLVGGGWVRLTVIRGSDARVRLLVDDETVLDAMGGAALMPAERIYLGMVELDAPFLGRYDPLSPIAPVTAPPLVRFDDIRLDRLGTGVALRLPDGMTGDGGTLLVLPDGSVAGAGTWVFRGPYQDQDATCTVSISQSGVTSDISLGLPVQPLQ